MVARLPEQKELFKEYCGTFILDDTETTEGLPFTSNTLSLEFVDGEPVIKAGNNIYTIEYSDGENDYATTYLCSDSASGEFGLDVDDSMLSVLTDDEYLLFYKER